MDKPNPGIGDQAIAAALASSLAGPRYELVPLKGVVDEIEHLPAPCTVAITTTARRGLPATLELAARLAGREGIDVVPHIPARSLASDDELRTLVARLEDLGISEVFVVGGDAAQPAGPFASALDLLEAMARRGHRFRVGIACYPEPHPLVSGPALAAALAAKTPLADYMVTQICFDPAVTSRWIAALRASRNALPVLVGVPGMVDLARLMRISLRIGIGDSIRYVTARAGTIARLAGGYRPGPYVEALGGAVADPALGIAGWHIYSFNAVEKTERWRREFLARLALSPRQ